MVKREEKEQTPQASREPRGATEDSGINKEKQKTEEESERRLYKERKKRKTGIL